MIQLPITESTNPAEIFKNNSAERKHTTYYVKVFLALGHIYDASLKFLIS